MMLVVFLIFFGSLSPRHPPACASSSPPDWLCAGIVGFYLFRGRLRHGCFYEEAQEEWVETGAVCDPMCTWDEATYDVASVSCRSLGNTTKQLGYYGIMMSWTCMPGQQCLCAGSAADEAACAWDDNPNTGIDHFDSILWSVVAIFQSITLEGWVDVMYTLSDGGNSLNVPGLGIVFQILSAPRLSATAPCESEECSTRRCD